MEEIDGVSMNIINDDRTPVRATAAAQGVNVARASVQLPDPNHWQTGLNSSVARDYGAQRGGVRRGQAVQEIGDRGEGGAEMQAAGRAPGRDLRLLQRQHRYPGRRRAYRGAERVPVGDAALAAHRLAREGTVAHAHDAHGPAAAAARGIPERVADPGGVGPHPVRRGEEATTSPPGRDDRAHAHEARGVVPGPDDDPAPRRESVAGREVGGDPPPTT